MIACLALLAATQTPPSSHCLVIETALEWPGRPIEGLQLFARGVSGGSIPLRPVAGDPRRYVACDLAEGRYTVTLTDPRFAPVTLEDVPTGEVRMLALEGEASIVLRCLAEPGGAAVVPHALELQLSEFDFPSVRVREGSSLVELDGVPTEELVGVAYFAALAPLRFELAGLLHGERRELDLVVSPGATLTGRVVDAAGAPVEGVPVVTYTGWALRETLRFPYWLEPGRDAAPPSADRAHEDPRRRRVARTSATGHYTFVGLAPGSHTVIAFGTPFTRDEVAVCVDAAIGAHGAPDLTLGGRGRADFEVELPDGLDPRDLTFELQLARGRWLHALDPDVAPLLDERGCIALRGLPERGCTLIVSRWVTHTTRGGGAWREQILLARQPFTPRCEASMAIVLRLRAP